jgi:hypothetical protein
MARHYGVMRYAHGRRTGIHSSKEEAERALGWLQTRVNFELVNLMKECFINSKFKLAVTVKNGPLRKSWLLNGRQNHCMVDCS